MTKDDILSFGGLASIVLTHATCLVSGIYKGSVNAGGDDLDIPMEYYLAGWGGNATATSLGASLNSTFRSDKVKNASIGVVAGTILAPTEFTIGYGVGYVGRLVIDKVFF
jgi:hypothetical protein